MYQWRSGEEERANWLSADYRRGCDPLCTPVQLKRPRHAPEPAPPGYGRYRALRNEVSEGDMESDIECFDEDPMEDFGICPPRGSASHSRQQREGEGYMEGVRRRNLGGAYMGEPGRSRLDFEEEMHVAPVETYRGRRWEPRSTSRLVFLVSKAADASV